MPATRSHRNASTHLKTLFKDFLGFSSTNSAVNSNLFVSSNTEGSHSVTGLRIDGLLSSQLLKHLKQANKNLLLVLLTSLYFLP